MRHNHMLVSPIGTGSVQVRASRETQPRERWCTGPGWGKATAPLSMRSPWGVTVILGSRKSPLVEVSRATEFHVLPPRDVITRKAPSDETWAWPSRKTQIHWPL